MIEPVDALLTGWTAAGVWAIASVPDDIENHAQGLGWWPIFTEGDLTSKHQFLQAVRKAAHFPPWVGNNWDAFEDAVTDLSWLPTGNILLVVPAPLPDMAIDILIDAARFWDHRQRRFGVVVHGTPLEGRAAVLPRLDQLRIGDQSPPMRPSGQ